MDLENHVRTMIARDQQIEAIKWVRRQTGWGLREAKEYVDEIARGMSPTSDAVDMAALEQEVRALIQRGSPVQAVKRVRETTGWGLRECKEYVDRLRESVSAGEAAPVLPLPTSRPLTLSTYAASQVRAVLAEKGKVEAIKLVRKLTDVGLREAKEYVDSLQVQEDPEDEAPIDEEEEIARLRTETALLMGEVDRLQAERERLEREHDRLLSEGAHVHTRLSRVSIQRKVGRNDPCPCGSGKKYKRCCGRRR